MKTRVHLEIIAQIGVITNGDVELRRMMITRATARDVMAVAHGWADD